MPGFPELQTPTFWTNLFEFASAETCSSVPLVTSRDDLPLRLVEPEFLSRIACITTPRRHKRTYDSRLRALVRAAGDPGVVADLGFPSSTVAGWLRGDPRPVASIDVLEKTDTDLQREKLNLRRRSRILQALVRPLLSIVHLSGFQLVGERFPNGLDEARVLKAIETARRALPLRIALRVRHISASRYHAWKRAEDSCGLDAGSMTG